MLFHFFWNLVIFIIALGVLTIIHECGHFLAARLCKVKVERFSIGFGPILWKWKDSYNTEYVISLIFLGGYVKLLNVTKNIIDCDQQNYAFNNKHFLKRAIIILSGSAFNFIFSILIYIVIFMKGMPIYKPIINSIVPNSIVSQCGILPGLEIKSINNIKTDSWEAVRMQVLNHISADKIIITAVKPGTIFFITYDVVLPKNWNYDTNHITDPIIALGILPFETSTVPILSKIQPYSAAAQAGLKVNDKILKINNISITSWELFTKVIQENPEEYFQLSVLRNNKILHLCIKVDKKYLSHFSTIEDLIGAFPKIVVVSPVSHEIHQYRLHQAILKAYDKTWQLICLITNTLWKLILGDINIINLIGGPISMVQGAMLAAQSGWIYYLMFLAIVSINLGVVNLLPLPILDGGNFFFLIIEQIIRKPISEKIQSFGQIIGLIILILIMCLSIFNDIYRLWR